MRDEQIIERLESALPGLLAGEAVAACWLFGSWACGKQRPDSDVDLAMLIRPEAYSRTAWPMPEIVLETRICEALRLPAEVHILNEAPLIFRGEVLETGRLIYCADHEVRIDFQVDTMAQYLDWKPRMEELSRRRLASFAGEKLL